MSAKNILQEFCQKNRLPIPVYFTNRISDIKSLPIFESIITFNNVTYRAQGSNKVAAEKEVAQQVCKFLSTASQPQEFILCQKYTDLTKIPIDQYSQIYLIDGDNCHVINENVFQHSTCLYIYFVAQNTTKPQPLTHQQKYANCCVFISESIGRDAVDHLLTFSLGQMSIIWSNKVYYVVTRDHFGECLKTFMKNCHLICSI